MRGRYIRQTWKHNPHLHAPRRYRAACRYDAFVPDPIRRIDLQIRATTAAAISDAETSIASLNVAPTRQLAPLARLLLRTESIASSKVEGLQVNARALARAEAKREIGKSSGTTSAEILASIDAMQLAIEHATEARGIRVKDLVEIHNALMRDAAPVIAGRVRSVQNWIGGNNYNPCGADFIPPPPASVKTLLADVCAFCNDDALSPLVQAALAHAQFETIHPFEDGNGRTGRALVQVILRKTGLAPSYVPPISVMLAKNRDAYIRGLTLFREGDIDAWLGIFADATAEAAQLAQQHLEHVRGLQDEWRAQLRALPNPPRADAAAWALIDALPAHPVTTVSIAVAATGRTHPAVTNAIRQLEAARVLRSLSTARTNRAWEAAGLLDLIVGLEEGRHLG